MDLGTFAQCQSCLGSKGETDHALLYSDILNIKYYNWQTFQNLFSSPHRKQEVRKTLISDAMPGMCTVQTRTRYTRTVYTRTTLANFPTPPHRFTVSTQIHGPWAIHPMQFLSFHNVRKTLGPRIDRNLPPISPFPFFSI